MDSQKAVASGLLAAHDARMSERNDAREESSRKTAAVLVALGVVVILVVTLVCGGAVIGYRNWQERALHQGPNFIGD